MIPFALQQVAGLSAGRTTGNRGWISAAHRALGLLPAIVLAGCFLTACSVDDDNWIYEGLRQVWVDTIVAPDTLGIADTLTVILDGEGGCDRPEFSHVDTVRDSFQLDLTVWADCYAWSGSGAKPPTDTSISCENRISPPFHAGRLLLVAHRPDGSTVSDTLLVLP